MVTCTRRVFLRDTIIGWVALVIGPTFYALARRWSFAASSEPSSPISIGSVDEFARNSSRILSLGGSKVIVARSQDGGFHSVSAVCTHLGCSIRYEERTDGPGFTCNCHSSRFGLQGENLGGMAPTPLKKYTVRVVAGEVWVSKGDGSSLP